MEGWQRAFVLHSRPYSETSLLVEAFSEGHGRVSLLAKGARARRSPLKGILQPFTPLLVRWSGRSAVKTLRNAEAVSLALPLSSVALYSALYVNELLIRVLEPEVAYPALFFDYLHCIQALAGVEGSTEAPLRRFELALLEQLGYGFDFLHCAGSGEPVSATMTYRYREGKGFIASVVQDANTFTGRDLLALAERRFPDRATLNAAKRFTRLALKPRLGGRPLKSRELFRQFLLNREQRAADSEPHQE